MVSNAAEVYIEFVDGPDNESHPTLMRITLPTGMVIALDNFACIAVGFKSGGETLTYSATESLRARLNKGASA